MTTTRVAIARTLCQRALWGGCLVLALGTPGVAWSQLNRDDVPEVARGIGVDPHLGAQLEMDLTFHDDQNHFVRLGDFFDGKKPVILSFNYSNCPKLCSVQLENMTLALRDVDFEVGKDFEIVSVSIDPLEQTTRARDTKAKYTRLYNHPGSETGWHFLVGKQREIEFLAQQCGFRYKYIRRQKLYSHPPVFILVSPQGKIVRYIHGLDYDPVTIERALIETAEGKIGSPINRLSFALGCYVFAETTGKYTTQVMGIMRLAGGLTVLGLLVSLVPYWFFKRNPEPNENDSVADDGEATQHDNPHLSTP